MFIHIYLYLVSKLKSSNESMITNIKKIVILAMKVKLSRDQSALLSRSIQTQCSTMIPFLPLLQRYKIILCFIQIQTVTKIM
jgi:hypothetical protein